LGKGKGSSQTDGYSRKFENGFQVGEVRGNGGVQLYTEISGLGQESPRRVVRGRVGIVQGGGRRTNHKGKSSGLRRAWFYRQPSNNSRFVGGGRERGGVQKYRAGELI